MKKYLLSIIATLLAFAPAMAQYEPFTENGIVSIADHRGFQFASKNGDFQFKPYILVQTAVNFNWYDDAGLDPAYNQDNVANSGFSIPYAVLGFTGKAFKIVTFNLSINASASGEQSSSRPGPTSPPRMRSASRSVSSRPLSPTPISRLWARLSFLCSRRR